MPCEHGLAAVLLPTIRSSSRWTSGMPSTPSVVTWCYEKCGSTSLPWPAGHPGATRQPAPCSLAVQPQLHFRSAARRPLGPLLFAAALQPVAAALRNGPVDFSVFYLDDGVLAGPVEAVAQALGTLQQASANLGLTLNLNKSEAIAVGRTSSAALAAHLPSALLTQPDG